MLCVLYFLFYVFCVIAGVWWFVLLRVFWCIWFVVFVFDLIVYLLKWFVVCFKLIDLWLFYFVVALFVLLVVIWVVCFLGGFSFRCCFIVCFSLDCFGFIPWIYLCKFLFEFWIVCCAVLFDLLCLFVCVGCLCYLLTLIICGLITFDVA